MIPCSDCCLLDSSSPSLFSLSSPSLSDLILAATPMGYLGPQVGYIITPGTEMTENYIYCNPLACKLGDAMG